MAVCSGGAAGAAGDCDMSLCASDIETRVRSVRKRMVRFMESPFQDFKYRTGEVFRAELEDAVISGSVLVWSVASAPQPLRIESSFRRDRCGRRARARGLPG